MVDLIDIRDRLPGARDQGVRPTCLAFAISDAHTVVAGHSDLLSAEYLHFHAAKRAGATPNNGVGVNSMRDALRLDGQPSEAECPYSAARDDTWTPPPHATSIWRCPSSVLGGSPSTLLASAIEGGNAHVLVFRISRSFFSPDPTSYVVAEDPGKDRRLHAVVIVGLKRAGGEAAFLARNSWGPGWGLEGHAWLSATYVDARGTAVLELESGRGTK